MSEKQFILRKMDFTTSDLNIPLYKESKNHNGWVNFGQDNLMPDYYLGLLSRSPKHNAIVNTKQQLIAGNGWQKEGVTPETLIFIKNPYGEADLEEVAARAAYDFEIFGAFALEIIWNEDRETIKSINHIPVNKVRAKVKDETDPYGDGYYICNNWRKWTNSKIIFCPKFSTVNRKEANQILYCKRYTPGVETYGIPAYMSGARWMELEYEISNFHLQAAKNGFTPGLHINIPVGQPDEDSIDREISRLRQEFEGTNNANAPFITFSDGDDNKISIESIDMNASDQRFIQLNQEITEGIMTAHQVVSPNLFGIMQEGMIVNKSATINDLQQFQAQYITPKQNFIEKVFNRLGAINGAEKIYLNRYELDYDVELSVGDLLSVIQSELPDAQKEQILISCGYRPEEAARLIETGVSGQPGNEPQTELSQAFKIINGNTRTRNNTIKSSNVWKFKWDDRTGDLVVKFQDGAVYTYYGVTEQDFEDFRTGTGGTCDTEGEKTIGGATYRWEIGKNPSVGAAVWQVLDKYNFAPVGNI